MNAIEECMFGWEAERTIFLKVCRSSFHKTQSVAAYGVVTVIEAALTFPYISASSPKVCPCLALTFS